MPESYVVDPDTGVGSWVDLGGSGNVWQDQATSDPDRDTNVLGDTTTGAYQFNPEVLGWTYDDVAHLWKDSSGVAQDLSYDSSGGVSWTDILKNILGSNAGKVIGGIGVAGILNKMLGGENGGAPVGYQGTIPNYTATRSQLPIPQTTTVPAMPATSVTPAREAYTIPRRPGSGGVTYFSPMQYSGGQSGVVSNLGAANTPVTPVTTPDPYVYQSENTVGNFHTVDGGLATGGIAGLNTRGRPRNPYKPQPQSQPRLLSGPGDGVSDSIPATITGKKGTQAAALADGEFVLPARAVSELGNGSTQAGAKKLYAMMDRINKSRTKSKNIAADTKADRHLPA